MADIVSSEKRSQMMAGIRGKNTKPELIIRSALHKKGFRFRLHVKQLPGRPDIVLAKHNAVIFIHGCFWHGHNCHLFKFPSTRRDFWVEKISKNRCIDSRSIKLLQTEGYRIGVIWECAIRGKSKLDFIEVIELCSRWIVSHDKMIEIHGQL
jgi:DNA mismatch endonuclease (patch repair protein)